MYQVLKKFDDLLERISVWGLVASLSLMLIISSLNIILRWFNITFLWFDPFVRHLVFFSAFLGGSLATSKGNHIRIDLAAKLLENSNNKMLKRVLMSIINLVCIIAVLWLMKASREFMVVEAQYPRDAFFGLNSGHLVGIIPVGLGLIALRFIFQFVKTVLGKEE
jgi:TRAP-type C4-dicarboxylate transport system permease small subunit